MTDSLSTQFIRFACKQCGKVFSKVPYGRIAQCGIAECSACKSRFTLDREDLQAALLDALSDERIEPVQAHGAESEAMHSNNLDIEEPPEVDAEDILDIENSQELDAENNLDIEENQELDAEDSLDIEENQELDAENNLDIEENQELDAEDNLDIEENQELDAEDSLDIEENFDSESFDTCAYKKNLSEPMHSVTPEQVMEPSPAAGSFDDTFTAAPEKASPAQTQTRPSAGFEPEKEDKVEFARRLSRLIPEGWVNQSQDFDNDAKSDASCSDFKTPDLQQLEGHQQFLIFALGTTEFAVPVKNTTEIGMVPELTRLPHVPDWLLGIINLRGDIVSMIDIKNFLGMGPFDSDSHDRIILLRSLQEDLCTAVIVNRIAGMQYVADEDIVMIDAEQQDTEPHIRGMFELDGRSIAVLDIENLLLSDDMQQFRAM